MRAVILAGGYGSRLSEETADKPKPMVEIGGRPILWHIMKIYSHHGINDFVICLGYKGYMIKEYFANYFLHTADVTFDMKNNRMDVHNIHTEPWRVTLVDTGENTMTGGRLRRVAEYLGDETFCFTYGDGVGNVDISDLISFHEQHGKIATVTATQPPGRFGTLILSENHVRGFQEKPKGDGGWISAGFFVLSRKAFGYIEGDATVWEQAPLQKLAQEDQLQAYRHKGFWQPMDTLRDKRLLEAMWQDGNPPWKVWT